MVRYKPFQHDFAVLRQYQMCADTFYNKFLLNCIQRKPLPLTDDGLS